MVADLADKIGPSLTSAGPVPAHGRELVEYAGGTRALVETLTGMDGPPRRRDYADAEQYEAARLRWRSASRRVQRWRTEGAQRRLTPKLDAGEKRRVRRQASAVKRARLRQRGLRARLKATVRVGSGFGRKDDVRTRDMPSGGPGVLLPPRDVAEILDALDDEGRDAVAEVFLGLFFAAYGLPEDAELDEVMWLRVWPEGEPEPE